jgi:hypothetical protein
MVCDQTRRSDRYRWPPEGRAEEAAALDTLTRYTHETQPEAEDTRRESEIPQTHTTRFKSNQTESERNHTFQVQSNRIRAKPHVSRVNQAESERNLTSQIQSSDISRKLAASNPKLAPKGCPEAESAGEPKSRRRRRNQHETALEQRERERANIRVTIRTVTSNSVRDGISESSQCGRLRWRRGAQSPLHIISVAL